MEEISKILEAIVEALNGLTQRVDNLENASLTDDDCEDNVCVTSLRDAMILYEHHRSAKYRQQLVDSLIANNVRERPGLYHNFIIALSRCGDHHLILKLCEYILTFAPLDRDILADAIDACGDTCNWELGANYLSKITAIPKKRWNAKLFTHVGGFLKARFNAFPNNDSYYEEALDLAEEYIDYFRHDEHGYSLKAQLLIDAQQRQEAMDFLEDTIKDGYSDVTKIEENRVVVTQCCSMLLDLLDDTCKYDLMIEICDKGLQYTHEQASSRIAYFAYRRALAYDARVYVDGFKNKEIIVAALEEMQSAHTILLNSGPQADEDKIIEQKYEALRRYAGDKFVPLVKRPLIMDET